MKKGRWRKWDKPENAAVLIETAIVLPVLLLVFVGGMIFGLATIEDVRLERIASDATQFTEPEADQLIAARARGGTLVCYWKGEGPGGCFDDGLDSLVRVQIVARGRTWQYPGGSVTPSAEVTRPHEEVSSVDTTVDE